MEPWGVAHAQERKSRTVTGKAAMAIRGAVRKGVCVDMAVNLISVNHNGHYRPRMAETKLITPFVR